MRIVVGDKANKVRAIVADDNQDILTLFCELLELNNFDVVGRAKNGKDAVEMFDSQSPDIVFLDVVMSNGDGIYALEKIRERNPEAIVIMVTSDVAPTTTERLRQLRASAVVHKPFDITDIIKVVEKLVPVESGRMNFFN